MTTIRSELVTEDSTAWWKVACPGGCGSSDGPSVGAAIAPSPRGAELFTIVPGSLSGPATYRTRSNIERNFAGSAGAPASSDTSSISVATADGGTTMDVVWLMTDKTVTTRSWNGSFFSSPTALPFGQLVAVGVGGKTNRVDVFGVGPDHVGLYQAYRIGTTWAGWYNVPGPTGGLAGLPPAVVWTSSAVWVFAVASDGTVRYTRNAGAAWDAWVSLGTVSAQSGVSATIVGNRIDVFVAASSGIVRKTSTDAGATWTPSSGWSSVGPAISIMGVTIDGTSRKVAPSAIARADGVIDLFVRDTNSDIQLMTIRPQISQSGNKERVIATAPSACANLTGGWGENTAAIAGGCAYFSMGDWGILQVPEASCFLNGPPPSSCTTPSGASIPTCVPFEIRFPGNPRYQSGPPGQDIIIPPPPYPGFLLDGSYFGQDNQIVRLGNGNVIALHHYGSTCSEPACSPAGTFCANGGPRTAADVIIRTTPTANCQNTWTYRGSVNPCHWLDPGTANNCFNTADHCNLGTGTDRPEMAARGTDLFVTETLIPDANWGLQFAALFKSTDEGATWTEWVANSSGRISPPPPLVMTSAGSHLVRFGRTANDATIWSQSATTKQNPTQTVLSSSDVFVLEYGDGNSLVNSAFSAALAGSSADGDYVRVTYVTLTSGRQAVKTALVRVNANETATVVPGSLKTISAPGQGSILYPTLIEAERLAGANGDERPPMVLFWVESTKTPPTSAGQCGHGIYCDWGTVTVKATVFRGGSQSPVYTVSTASSTAWKGNGDYVHGGSRNVSGTDRFFLHWYNENSTGARLPMARLFDAVR